MAIIKTTSTSTCRNGRTASRSGSRWAARPAAAALLALALGGCGGLSDYAADAGAIGVGAVVGGVTGNPLIGFAAGAGAQIAFSEGLDLYRREAIGVVQAAIAETAGNAPVGEQVAWTAESDLPIVSESGTVQVLNDYGGEIPCREIVFSDDAREDMFFIATICQGGAGWTWAVPEPAIERWGGLQ
jgi:hypothetical protein